MRKIIPLVIQNIMYHRIDLDDNLFANKNIKDWEYRVFKVKTKHRLTSDVFYWCKSISNVMLKKQVKHLYLIFVNTCDNSMIEHYKFSLKYEQQPSISIDGDSLLANTKRFFAIINSLGSFAKLVSDDISVLIEVEFNEGVTNDLKMPNFEVTSSSMCHNLDSTQYTPLGKIDTGYHSAVFGADGHIFRQEDNTTIVEIDDEDGMIDEGTGATHINGESYQLMEVANEHQTNLTVTSAAEDSGQLQIGPLESGGKIRGFDENTRLLSSSTVESMLFDDQELIKISEVQRDEAERMKSPIVSDIMDVLDREQEEISAMESIINREKPIITFSTGGILMQKIRRFQKEATFPNSEVLEDMVDIRENEELPLQLDEFRPNTNIDCPCDLKLSLGISGTFACIICARVMHTVCAGYQTIDNVPRSFICSRCGSRSCPATDITLVGKKPNEVKFRSVFRLILRYCVVNKKYPEELVERLNVQMRKNMKRSIATAPGFQIKDDDTFFIDENEEYADFMEMFFLDFSSNYLAVPKSMTL